MKIKLTKNFSFPTFIGVGIYKKGLTLKGKKHKMGMLYEMSLYNYLMVIPKEYFKIIK